MANNVGGNVMKNYVITISREYGSGGRLIGEELAKRPQIAVANKCDIATEEQIAKNFGITRQTFSKYKKNNISIFNAIKKGYDVVFLQDNGNCIV